MREFALSGLAAALACAMLATPSLAAQTCHAISNDGALVPLRARPRDDAKVVVSIPDGYVINPIPSSKGGDAFVYVKWWTPQREDVGKKARKASGRA